MSPPLCPSCGLTLAGTDLCSHHHTATPDDWAVGNRLVCNLIHRKQEPPNRPVELNDYGHLYQPVAGYFDGAPPRAPEAEPVEWA